MQERPWLKNYPKSVKWDEKIEPKPIFSLFDDSCSKFADNLCLDFEGNTYSYKQVEELVDKATKAFVKLGVSKGNKVAIFLPNCPQFIITYLAVLKAGGTIVNCSPLYSEDEVKFLAEDSDAEIIVTLNLKILFPKAENALKTLPKVKKIIVGNLPEVLPFPKNLLFKLFKGKEVANINYSQDILTWDGFLKSAENENSDYKNIKIDVNDTAIIQYTGGTTGTPKGAELSHTNCFVNAIQSKSYINRREDGTGKILTVLPLFHVFAMTTAMLYGFATGASLLLHPRFVVTKVLKDIQKKKPTAMPGVPTMYNALNNYEKIADYDLTSIETCISGGGALPVEVKKRFEELSTCIVVEGYGLTETSPVVSANPVDAENRPGTIGLPLPLTEILIEDMENPGNYLGVGERGELCVKGPQVMKGYYKKPEATKEVFYEKGILKTGDVAIIDEDGYVRIVDRIKEMINSGGFKIYPRHVEEALYEHPDILECAVKGVPDDYSGERVKAFIVLKDGATISEEEIKIYCKEKLAKHEVPKYIEIRDSLPKSPVGKILKKEL